MSFLKSGREAPFGYPQETRGALDLLKNSNFEKTFNFKQKCAQK